MSSTTKSQRIISLLEDFPIDAETKLSLIEVIRKDDSRETIQRVGHILELHAKSLQNIADIMEKEEELEFAEIEMELDEIEEELSSLQNKQAEQ